MALEYEGTQVFHTLYLPTDWNTESPAQTAGKFPVIVEYAGNGPYRNKLGDTCSGNVEDCGLGFGISGGKKFIWVCLPYISKNGQHNQRMWWGDLQATVDYCKKCVPRICKEYGGDPGQVFLVGFSRGAIACNYIGLHDKEIAKLWRGFVCHSHYDGAREWSYKSSDRESALKRLRRLNGRPQFVSHEQTNQPTPNQKGGLIATKQYLQWAAQQLGSEFSSEITYLPLPFPNHTDAWVLRDSPERRKLRSWVSQKLVSQKLGIVGSRSKSE